ncbi:glycosyltransferase [Bacillus haimaensis]|uniref:glycosyltransferase n=1 Tax=Bacillus haimaensis TaxID=3160967 RepID=UPI003AA9AB0E
MKKNILFVIPNLCAGGAEKSLVNLLSHIDYRLYKVDLFLFHKSGTFTNSIPKEVNILDSSERFSAFCNGFFYFVFYLIKRRELKAIFHRVIFTLINRLVKNKNLAEQYTWKQLKFFIEGIEKEYDVAISYLEKSSLYYTVEKVRAQKKIGWIHTNYTNSGMKNKLDKEFLKQLNSIITVSEECRESLYKEFPENKDKTFVINNILSPTVINVQAAKVTNDLSKFESDYLNIVTIARLSYEKGIDLALKSCVKLIKHGYKVKWFIIGEGPERKLLEKLIKINNLEQNFVLLGIKENPYPYLKKADIYVQPSRYEGKSIAIEEAKILQKPIIITNFQTARDQIQSKYDGLVVNMDEKGIFDGVISLLNNISLRKQIIRNLNEKFHGNENEIIKFYEIIEGEVL